MRHDTSFSEPRPADAAPDGSTWQQVMEATGSFRSEVGIEDGASHSGHEPNDLFVSTGGGAQFARLSGLSGFDHRGDGRSLASMDLDRDGRTDLVAVNANAPLLQVFHNEVGDGTQRFLAVQLTGGNQTRKSSQWSPRQPIGALVTAQVGGTALLRELRAGEGLAAQSSGTLLFGLGAASEAGPITVRWPSGRSSVVPRAPAGTLVRVWEDPSAAPSPDGFAVGEYGPAVPMPASKHPGKRFPVAVPGDAPFTVVTSMATWCEACREELPDLVRLKAALSTRGVAWVGVPVDHADTVQGLQQWVDQHGPPWDLVDPGPPSRGLVRDFLESETGRPAVPSWALLDRTGQVLTSGVGTPSLSTLRQAISGSY